MYRFLCAVALGASVCSVQPALAQRSSDRDDTKGQDSKIDKLRAEVRDAMVRLQRARREASQDGDDKAPPASRERRGRENPKAEEGRDRPAPERMREGRRGPGPGRMGMGRGPMGMGRGGPGR